MAANWSYCNWKIPNNVRSFCFLHLQNLIEGVAFRMFFPFEHLLVSSILLSTYVRIVLSNVESFHAETMKIVFIKTHCLDRRIHNMHRFAILTLNIRIQIEWRCQTSREIVGRLRFIAQNTTKGSWMSNDYHSPNSMQWNWNKIFNAASAIGI